MAADTTTSFEVVGSADEAADIRAAVAGLTVPTLLARQCRSRPDAVSIHWMRDGEWQAWTWRQYGAQVARMAGALERLGFGRGDRALLMTHPRPEFHVIDSAVLLLGGCPISIYNSSPAERVRYLAAHCRASLVVVEGRELLARVLAVRAELPDLRHVVVIDPAPTGSGDTGGGTGSEAAGGENLGGGAAGDVPPGVLRWDDLLAADPVDLEARAATAGPDDPCTVIYTSGTIGVPKGVMLDHRAVIWQCESYLRRLDRDLTGARWVSYLPVAHIATRFYAQYFHVYAGLEDITCPNPADVESVLIDRPPHLFFAPPRLWEKYLISLREWIGAMDDPARATRLTRAMRVGEEAALLELTGGDVPPRLAREREELRPATRELRARLGLGDLLTGAIGAAPANPQLTAAWIGLGVPMFEGYGLSESTGMLTVDPFAYRLGSVGRPMPGVELRVAPDGELHFRAGSAFRSYLDDPEQTAAAVDAEGWVRTGDLATIDDGYVRLRGRKKELIITAGGENVSPVAVEFALAAQLLVGQVCVLGDGQPALGALVVLDPQAAAVWAGVNGIPFTHVDELAADPRVLAEVGRQIARANDLLVRQEKVRRFHVLRHEWPLDSDELTPTAKLRRDQIAAKYQAEIAAMFAAPANVEVMPRAVAANHSS
ncbi:AMP-dependent synthetase and ligase [Parafrankia sp. Ea1.12]|uniref:AMP-dependent synthetase/ligase n=1 Tax=Parafrankia sp. Ea1.12 TaxID=573499 RepID=UPI000DA5274C|nr:AMP-binding protein [Parafrankia sp. Ea1.12]SQE00362.1 AMP-dependent synthetase and ligase [Parafrankia sp. Ea1.12]